MPWYSSTSWTVMPIGEPPRQIATRNVGRKPLRTICMASSIESRSSDSAEMNTLSTACEGGGEVTSTLLRTLVRHFDTSRGPKRRAVPRRFRTRMPQAVLRDGEARASAVSRASCQDELALLEQIEVRPRNETRRRNAESSEQVRRRLLARADTIGVSQNHLEFDE